MTARQQIPSLMRAKSKSCREVFSFGFWGTSCTGGNHIFRTNIYMGSKQKDTAGVICDETAQMVAGLIQLPIMAVSVGRVWHQNPIIDSKIPMRGRGVFLKGFLGVQSQLVYIPQSFRTNIHPSRPVSTCLVLCVFIVSNNSIGGRAPSARTKVQCRTLDLLLYAVNQDVNIFSEILSIFLVSLNRWHGKVFKLRLFSHACDGLYRGINQTHHHPVCLFKQ